MRYNPWCEVRYTWTTSLSTTPAYQLTRYTYTGQYSYMDDPTTAGVTEGFGLMFYNARWYDPGLGRFAQADTIIPVESQGVQAWDRYAGMNNNPVRYNDPSGHISDDQVRKLVKFKGNDKEFPRV
jgi:RHS repeat-associated protein